LISRVTPDCDAIIKMRKNICIEEEFASFKVKEAFDSHQKEKKRVAFFKFDFNVGLKV